MAEPRDRPTSPETSWTVVLSAGRSNQEARAAFAMRYAPVIRRYLASRWRIAPDAPRIDDALQDVFVECFKPGGALERIRPGGDGGFRAYLFAVTRNVARSDERIRPLESLADADSRPDPRTPRPSVCFDRDWARVIAAEGMAEFQQTSVQPVQRLEFEVVRLRFHGGLPPRAIATRLEGLTARRISKLIETGLRRYQDGLFRVLQRHHPEASRRQLERLCRSVLQAL